MNNYEDDIKELFKPFKDGLNLLDKSFKKLKGSYIIQCDYCEEMFSADNNNYKKLPEGTIICESCLDNLDIFIDDYDMKGRD